MALPLSFFSSSSTFCVALLTEPNTLASSYAAFIARCIRAFNSLCTQHGSFAHTPRPFLPWSPHVLLQVGVETSRQLMFTHSSDTVRSMGGVITKRGPEECRVLISVNDFQPSTLRRPGCLDELISVMDNTYTLMLRFCTIYSQNAFFFHFSHDIS